MFDEDIEFLTALANGVNYFTGERCESDSVLNDINVVRALFNLRDKLAMIKPNNVKKVEFQFTDEIVNNFDFEDKKITLSEIVRKIAKAAPMMKKIKYGQIFDVLSEKGLVEKRIDVNGSSKGYATEKAIEFGITNIDKVSVYGKKYTSIVYDRKGQEFVLSILKDVKK